MQRFLRTFAQRHVSRKQHILLSLSPLFPAKIIRPGSLGHLKIIFYYVKSQQYTKFSWVKIEFVASQNLNQVFFQRSDREREKRPSYTSSDITSYRIHFRSFELALYKVIKVIIQSCGCLYVHSHRQSKNVFNTRISWRARRKWDSKVWWRTVASSPIFLEQPTSRFSYKTAGQCTKDNWCIFNGEGWSQQIMTWFSFYLHTAIYSTFLEM